MKKHAQAFVDKTRQTAPKERLDISRDLAEQELLVSSRLIQIANVVLQTRNISSIQKFQRADHALIEGPVMARVRLFAVLAVVILVIFFGLGLTFGPGWLVLLALIALPLAYYAWSLWRVLQAKSHVINDFYVEIAMNSGRRHRFYTANEDSADQVVALFLTLLSSEDDGTLYRFEPLESAMVKDDRTRTLEGTALSRDLRFEADHV